MLETSHGRFRHEARENFDRGTVDFTLDLGANGTKEIIDCCVSREALEDRAGTSGEVPVLVLYEKLRHEVWAAVDRRLKINEREPDQSIVVRSGELRSIE